MRPGKIVIYCMTKFCNQLFSSLPRSLPPTYSCVDCQSRYFDCEFDQNDNDTRQDHSDGGLGAGNFNYGVCVLA